MLSYSPAACLSCPPPLNVPSFSFFPPADLQGTHMRECDICAHGEARQLWSPLKRAPPHLHPSGLLCVPPSLRSFVRCSLEGDKRRGDSAAHVVTVHCYSPAKMGGKNQKKGGTLLFEYIVRELRTVGLCLQCSRCPGGCCTQPHGRC